MTGRRGEWRGAVAGRTLRGRTHGRGTQNEVMKAGDIVVVPAREINGKLRFWDVLGHVSTMSSMVYWLDRASR